MDSPDRPAQPRVPDLSKSRLKDLPVAAPLPTLAGHGTPGPGSIETPGGRLHAGIVLVPGQVLADRYEIRSEIGRGGMGVVYAANDRLRNEEIAVKVMLPHLLLDPQARSRFTAEATAATRLGHPNVVRVFDSHEANGQTFLTMELLQGNSLRAEMLSRAGEQRRFTVDEVRKMATELCAALGYAHEQGIVHRDVKPENVWLCEDGSVKLMDFGIARLLRPSQFTSIGMALGTAYYVAPEQLKGRSDVDHRADQYAVAVVLYELLTGDVPQGAISPPHELRRGIPEGLSRAIMRALKGQPKDRFTDMAEFRAALESRNRVKWPRWVAAATVFAGLIAAGVVFASSGFNRPKEEGLPTAPAAVSAPTQTPPVAVTGPTRDQAVAALDRAELARQSLATASADLPAALRPTDVARVGAKWEEASAALNRGDFAVAVASADEATKLAQGARETADKLTQKWNAARITLKELTARRDQWRKVAALEPTVMPPAATPAESEYQSARQKLEAGEFDAFATLAERAGRQFDEASSAVSGAVQVRVAEVRGKANRAVKEAEAVRSELMALVRDADQAFQRLETKKAPEAELALARQALRDRTRILKGFESSTRLKGLLDEAAATTAAGEALVREQPAEAGRQFALARSKAEELTSWLLVVRQVLDQLDAGWARVAAVKALPGVPDGWAVWSVDLLAVVPDKLLEGDGTAALKDARAAVKFAGELPKLLEVRQDAEAVGKPSVGAIGLTVAVKAGWEAAVADLKAGDDAVHLATLAPARVKYAGAKKQYEAVAVLVGEARDVLAYRDKVVAEGKKSEEWIDLTEESKKKWVEASNEIKAGNDAVLAGKIEEARVKYAGAKKQYEAVAVLVGEARDVLAVRDKVVAEGKKSEEWIDLTEESKKKWVEASNEIKAGNDAVLAGKIEEARVKYAGAKKQYEAVAVLVGEARDVLAVRDKVVAEGKANEKWIEQADDVKTEWAAVGKEIEAGNEAVRAGKFEDARAKYASAKKRYEGIPDLARKSIERDAREEEFEYVIEGEKKKGKCRVVVLDVGNSEKMEFVRIEKGTFLMGAPADEKDASENEKPQRRVEITKDFYLGKHAVTQAQYRAVMGDNPSHFKGDRLPVETVSWEDADKFCKQLSKKLKWSVTLPTEAQWEYACRAGTTTPFHFGSKLRGDLANHNGNYPYGTEAKGAYKEKTVEVGSYPANPWGLYDMHGNVWQWCQDYYGGYDKVEGSKDPVQLNKQSDNRRVLRGGSWNDYARGCRAALRSWISPDYRGNFLGFRVCLRLD